MGDPMDPMDQGWQKRKPPFSSIPALALRFIRSTKTRLREVSASQGVAPPSPRAKGGVGFHSVEQCHLEGGLLFVVGTHCNSFSRRPAHTHTHMLTCSHSFTHTLTCTRVCSSLTSLIHSLTHSHAHAHLSRDETDPRRRRTWPMAYSRFITMGSRVVCTRLNQSMMLSLTTGSFTMFVSAFVACGLDTRGPRSLPVSVRCEGRGDASGCEPQGAPSHGVLPFCLQRNTGCRRTLLFVSSASAGGTARVHGLSRLSINTHMAHTHTHQERQGCHSWWDESLRPPPLSLRVAGTCKLSSQSGDAMRPRRPSIAPACTSFLGTSGSMAKLAITPAAAHATIAS